MDYEQKYKDALRRAKKLYGQGTITECLGWVFPELEDEDERIKREILELVSISGNGNQFEEIKDWLEKQGEQKLTQNEEAEKIREEILGVARTAVKINGPLYGKKYNYEKWVDWFEKQNKTLDSEKVIEWMHQHLCTACWDDPNEAISLRIEQFKKDFGL